MYKALYLLTFLMSIPLFSQSGSISQRISQLENARTVVSEKHYDVFTRSPFVWVKEFEDHTERRELKMVNGKAEMVEVFIDKKDQSSAVNLFTGDYQMMPGGLVSVRLDRLEGKPLPLPLALSLKMAREKRNFYLVNVQNGDLFLEARRDNK